VKSRSRALILNNYPLDRVLREVEIGETPEHLLFGVNSLISAGIDPVYLPYPAEGPWSLFQDFLRRLRLPLELGDLQQQILALRLSKSADIIYAPCGTQTHLLQYLRAIGLFNLPIVTLLHHPFPQGRLDALRTWQRLLFIRGADYLPTLSKTLASDLVAQGIPPNKLHPLTWGTDLNFYGDWSPPGSGVIAVGRTARDYKTFALAAHECRERATIIALEGHLDDPVFRATPRLKVIQARNEEPVPGENRGWMKYTELCSHIRAHAVLAIPLYAQRNIAGLTGLMDALGLGRAILMTRNRLIDLDIEAEGIGFWIEPGDVHAWAHYMSWMDSHPEEVISMGRRARNLAERSFNSCAFSRSIVSLLKDALRS